ncbi:MAG TPA: DUF4870 domain-containing protein [Negativicutes bacterium]|jgi:hypothetical protein
MNITGEQKLLALTAHIAYLLGGLGFIIAPLVILLLKKEDPFVYDHAKQALVAHLMLVVVSAGISLLCIVVVGVLLLPVLAILWVGLFITSLIASGKAINGELYHYPLIQKLVNKF